MFHPERLAGKRRLAAGERFSASGAFAGRDHSGDRLQPPVASSDYEGNCRQSTDDDSTDKMYCALVRFTRSMQNGDCPARSTVYSDVCKCRPIGLRLNVGLRKYVRIDYIHVCMYV